MLQLQAGSKNKTKQLVTKLRTHEIDRLCRSDIKIEVRNQPIPNCSKVLDQRQWRLAQWRERSEKRKEGEEATASAPLLRNREIGECEKTRGGFLLRSSKAVSGFLLLCIGQGLFLTQISSVTRENKDLWPKSKCGCGPQ